jgi:hypothetical protein
MADHGSTDRPTRRSNSSTGSRTAGNLPALALARGRAGLFGHLTALVDIPIGRFLADLV